jgi:beta-glucanase (GH16 family)
MNNRKYNRFTNLGLAVLFLSSLILFGCEVEKKQNLEERTWELTWSDEFEGEFGQAIDESKWTYDIGRGDNGWGNQELQYYTDSPSNVSLDGEGNMVITARKESFSGAPFTSARVKTQNLFSQTYGRFEARLKTPYGPGLWPAFWLLGSNVEEVVWPQCGEIDIMELRGQQPNIINGTIHGPGYSAGSGISGTYGFTDERFDTEFHIFAVEWGEDFIELFVDEILYKRITSEDVPGEWVYDHDFFMILNVAVGGNYVGFPTSQTPFPQKMIVDYVRVYK